MSFPSPAGPEVLARPDQSPPGPAVDAPGHGSHPNALAHDPHFYHVPYQEYYKMHAQLPKHGNGVVLTPAVDNRSSDNGYARESSSPLKKAAFLPAFPPAWTDEELGRMLPMLESALYNGATWVRGEPTPLGLLAFGMTTIMLSFVYTTWSEGGFINAVVGYAFAYGGFIQLLAGLLEIIKGKTYAGTVLASYGGFWIGWALFSTLAAAQPEQFGSIEAAKMGLSLWAGLWGVLTFAFCLVSIHYYPAITCILTTLTVTFALVSAGVWHRSCYIAAGYLAFICGCFALYTALALIVKIDTGFTLPLLRKTGIPTPAFFREPPRWYI